jgi:hypothetical protein
MGANCSIDTDFNVGNMRYLIRIPLEPCVPEKVGAIASIQQAGVSLCARIEQISDTHAYYVVQAPDPVPPSCTNMRS